MPTCWRGTKDVVARENPTMGFSAALGESYAQLTVRLRAWYETVEKDTVVAAHGGRPCAHCHLAIAPPEDATNHPITMAWSTSLGSGLTDMPDGRGNPVIRMGGGKSFFRLPTADS